MPTGSYGYPPTGQAPPPPTTPPPPPAPPEPARPPYQDVPTQAFAFDPNPTQAYPFDGAFSGATEVLGAHPVGLPELRDEGMRPPHPPSAIDALFGESQFQEYEAGVLPSEGFSALASTRPREPREPMGRPQKALLWVAGGLLAALALVGLFMLGTKLSDVFPAQAPVADPTSTATAVAEARPPAVGPVAPGTYAWNALLGTECLDQYLSPWQEEYIVVDCAAPHSAQMVFHGYFGDEAYAPYPGVDELQSRINLLCTSTSTVNYSVASGYADIQVGASYAATAEEWDAGERDYYCFVSRSSTEPFAASVANAVVPSETAIASVPGNEP
jgi:hypothetical protein